MRVIIISDSSPLEKAISDIYEVDWEINLLAITDALDMRNLVQSFKAKPDIVIFMPNRDYASKDTLMAFKNIQSAALVYRVQRIIAIGSKAEYGLDTFDMVTESDLDNCPLPKLDHATTLRTITMLARKDKLTTVVRPFDMFGYNIHRGTTSTMMKACILNQDFLFSNEFMYSTVYVEDVARLLFEIISKDIPKGEYNIGGQEPSSNLETVRQIKRASNKLLKVDVLNDKILGSPKTCSGIELMSRLPDFKFTPFRAAIARAYRELSEK